MPVGQTTRQLGRLPAETTGLVGREAELTRLGALLADARLVTVTGPGGVGKTRLAIRAATMTAPQFADGVCLVELAALHDPELLADTVANVLGLPNTMPQLQFEALLGALRDQHLLLILDNCEHIIDACAMFAEAVIAQAPRVTLLATSREPLDVSGESSCPVRPLPVPDLATAAEQWGRSERGTGRGTGRRPLAKGQREACATGDSGTGDSGTGDSGTAVDLFLQRAAAAVPGFTAGPDDMPDVVRLCRRLDGMPLAIELAAVRLRALPLAELADRLDHRIGLLAAAYLGGRHTTLRDTTGWSYDLCTPAEQATWARLSVFSGPFSLAAAEDVCGSAAAADLVLPTLIRLVDKSILLRIDTSGGSGGYSCGYSDSGQSARYRMLDTIAEFGAEQLELLDDGAVTKRRFVARYQRLAETFRDHLLDDDQLDLLSELRGEHANLLAALEYTLNAADSPPGDGVALATALFAYWHARGLTGEGRHWLGKAAARARADSAALGHALFGRGYLAALGGDGEQSVADAAEVVRLGALHGDELLTARGELLRNLALCVAGQPDAAAEAGRVAQRKLAALDDRPGLITLHSQLACLALCAADFDGALGHVERGLRILGGARERWFKASLHLLAALALYMAGRDIEATWAVTGALRVKHEACDVLGLAFTLEIAGWLAARNDRFERAAWLLGGADYQWGQTGGRLAAAAELEQLHAGAVTRAAAALGGKRFADLFTRGTRQPVEELVTFAVSGADHPGGDITIRARPPGQLTAREHEIATLVAEGLSNRQIGERLFISRRTVDAHLEHIFGKLGITSRVVLAIRVRGDSGQLPADPVNV